MTGTTTDAQVGASPRPGVRGPDLTKYPEAMLRKVFHGTVPSQVIGILSEGARPRLTQEDVSRQRNYSPKKDPKGAIYVTKFKRNAAGYPMETNDKSGRKMGEKFTDDDTPDYGVVLEGHYVIQLGDSSTRLWENNGTKKKDGKGGHFYSNQQWAIVPQSVTWTCVHWYPIENPVKAFDMQITLRDEMKWKEKEWNRRCGLAQSRVVSSDLDSITEPTSVPAFAPPKNIPDPQLHPNWVPGHLRSQKRTGRGDPKQSESSADGGGAPGGPPADSGDEEVTPGRASGSKEWRHEDPAGFRTTVSRTFVTVVEDKPKTRRVQSAPPPVNRHADDSDADRGEDEARPKKKRKKKDKKEKKRRAQKEEPVTSDDFTGDDIDGEEVSSELTNMYPSDDEPIDIEVFEKHRDTFIDMKPKGEPTAVDLFPWAKKIHLEDDERDKMKLVIAAHTRKKAVQDFVDGIVRSRGASKSAGGATAPMPMGEASSSSAGRTPGGPPPAAAPLTAMEVSSSSSCVTPGGPPTSQDLDGKTKDEQSQIIGNFLYDRCLKLIPRFPSSTPVPRSPEKQSQKVVGMLLDAYGRAQLLEICNSQDMLMKEVQDALKILRTWDATAFRTRFGDKERELPPPGPVPRPVGPAPPPQASQPKRPRDKPRPEPFDSTKGYPGEGPGVLVSGGRKKVSRAKNQPVRDVKRGELAWKNVEKQADRYGEAAQRLLVHTVADDVGLKQYLPAVKKFLDFAQRERLNCMTWEEIDSALLRYMGMQCYVENKHPQQGVLAINGVCYLYPEAVRELPHAWRATKGWSRFAIVKEGQPVPLQALVCMSLFLRSIDDPKADVAADCIELAADGYLREQDLFQLRYEDVILTDNAATLLLGKGERGEGCKSGRDQGVVLDEPNSIELLQRALAGKQKGDKVFDIGADNYRRYWRKAAKEVLGDSQAAGTPHSARHTGASRDLTEGYRNLEQVMKRGRWKALNSVHRYAKPHAWYAALAALPRQVREQGDLILNARAPRKQLAT